jgi:hypothetical protein
MSTQPPLFPEIHPTGPSGEQLKAEAMELLHAKYDSWIDWARTQAFLWLRAQPAGTVISSDDVWERWAPPRDHHPSCMGPILRDRRFKMVGYAKSRRATAHARVISIYQLR